MMKTILTSFVLALTFGVGTLLHAAPSPDEILDRHIQAIGGETAFKKLTSRHAKSKLDIPSAGLSANIEIYAKAPDKTYSEINIPGIGIIKEGYDGTVAWTHNPFMGIVEKEGAQLEMAKSQADFYRDVELKKRYRAIERKDNATVDGTETYVLEGTTKEGTTETLYIGTQDHMIHQMAVQIPTGQGNMSTKMRFDDYREVDGIKMPFAIKMVEPEEGQFTMEVLEIEHNVKIDDAKFAKPSQ